MANTKHAKQTWRWIQIQFCKRVLHHCNIDANASKPTASAAGLRWAPCQCHANAQQLEADASSQAGPLANTGQALCSRLPCRVQCRGALSTRPARDHIGKSYCLAGGICFQLLCICMAWAGRPPQPSCRCGGFRCICIDIAVVEDSLAIWI